MMHFTIHEGREPVARVESGAAVQLSVQQRPAGPNRLPPDPLPIPPRGFVVVDPQMSGITGQDLQDFQDSGGEGSNPVHPVNPVSFVRRLP